MNREESRSIVAGFLAPLTVNQFLGALGRETMTSVGDGGRHRASLFGPKPRETVLSAFASHSTNLEYHSPAPIGPPPPVQKASSEADFLSLIRAYHQRGYTVRVPDVASLSPTLHRLLRAFECLLHQPASAALFWSYPGARAQIHYDHRDNFVLQLEGRKRWFLSTEPPALYNDWMQLGAPPVGLRDPQIVDVEPGDVIYVPRGTPHSVESTTESLHVAILVNPITVREMLIAAIDHLSDSDRSFRETAFAPAELDDESLRALIEKLTAGSEKLMQQCRSRDFVRDAVQHRSARAISGFPGLPRPAPGAEVHSDTRVRHTSLAMGAIRKAQNSLGFSQPGTEFAIHPGVEQELRYITDTPEFRVADVPGHSAIEVRAALVQRLINTGFLEVV